MNPKICISIGNTDLNGAYSGIDYAKSNGAGFVELRFDMIAETALMAKFNPDASLEKIKKIISYAKANGIKLIGTYRDEFCGLKRHVSLLEGRRFSETTAETGKDIKATVKENNPPARIKFLKSAIEAGIDICDIELDILKSWVIKDFVDFAHYKNSEVILSVHDFHGQIGLQSAIKYYIDSCYFGADYFKLADTVVSENDAAKVMEKNVQINSIKTAYESAFPEFIVFGMGEKGKITRAFSIIYGSYLAYCSSPIGTTAPGQTDIAGFREMVKCAAGLNPSLNQ